ncbi:MAG: hypothetical protein ACKV2O_12075 [Acidimicrobiales bacterium]
MSLLFRAAMLVCLLATVIGYGAVFFAVLLGPLVRRLDAADAAAVARAGYRLGARRAEQAMVVVGPAGALAVAASDGTLSWSSVWFWAAEGAWLASVVLRWALVQPARGAQLVALGELAGGGAPEHGTKRAHAASAAQRMQIGLLLILVLFVAAAALVSFRPWP